MVIPTFYRNGANMHGMPRKPLQSLCAMSSLPRRPPLPHWTKASSAFRFDRLTPSGKKYLRAMAELGPGPHPSGDIADELDRGVTSLGPTRSQLIAKGMIWSPSHGDTAFTVPLFDEFMRRIMPGDDWKQ